MAVITKFNVVHSVNVD